VKAPIAVVPRPRPRPDVQVWRRTLLDHGLNRVLASISALRAIRLSPTAALPFLSVLRHVQVSPGRLTFVSVLFRNRPFTLSRFPRVLSRLAFSPARPIPSRRHPWGFSLQRFDLVLSPVAFRRFRALLFLGSPHPRHESRTSRFDPRGLRQFGWFAGFHAGCVWRFAGPSGWVSVRCLFRGATLSVPLSRKILGGAPFARSRRATHFAFGKRLRGPSDFPGCPGRFREHLETPKHFRYRHLVSRTMGRC